MTALKEVIKALKKTEFLFVVAQRVATGPKIHGNEVREAVLSIFYLKLLEVVK